MVEPISSTFPSCKTVTPCQLNTDAPPTASGPWQPPSYSLSPGAWPHLVPHASGIVQCLSLWLAYFTEHNVLQVYLCIWHQDFLPFKSRVVFHCLDGPLFLYSLPTGNLGCFHFLVAVNNASLDIGIQITLFLSSSSLCLPLPLILSDL